MISSDTLWGILAMFIIQLGLVIFGYGQLTQRVKDLGKKIDNGWTCKAHTELCERIARIEGSSDPPPKS